MPISVSEFERLAGDVLAVYEQAEVTMLGKITARLSRGVSSAGWADQKYSEIRLAKKELAKTVNSLSKNRKQMTEEMIANAYNSGNKAFVDEAQMFTDLTGIAHISPNSKKVAAILYDLNNSLDAADRTILRNINDAYADIVGRTSARVATGTITVRNAVQEELNQLADKGITSFVDRAGRYWEMANYAEMATLTAIERATLEGYTDTMKSYGYDLAIISNHVGACPLCAAWEGVVISVSGENHKYPSLAEAESGGVFHPRCLHHISTYYEGITKGARSSPREVKQPTKSYSMRAKQRSFEVIIRRWKRRMATAGTPEVEREAYAYVRYYQQKVRTLIGSYNSSTSKSSDWLPRKYWREGGRVLLSAGAKKLKPISLEKYRK